MRALAALLVCLPAAAESQFDLATSYDGSVLYFSAVTTDANSRIYRWSRDTGVALFGDRPDLQMAHLYATQLTYAGSVLYHAEHVCSTGLGPGFNNCDAGQTQVAIPSLPQFSLSGFLLVSPNGRYGVAIPYGSGGLWMDWFTGQQIEVDFKGQNVPQVTPPFSVNQHAIANNGSFLITDSGHSGVRVWSPNGEVELPTADYLMNASISADGSTVALNPFDHTLGDVRSPTFLYSMNAANPAAATATFPQFVSMSDDGKTVAYLSSSPFDPNNIPQALVANADATGARQVTNLPNGVFRVLISGDGRYLYVIAKDQQPVMSTHIQRYELATGMAETIPLVQ